MKSFGIRTDWNKSQNLLGQKQYKCLNKHTWKYYHSLKKNTNRLQFPINEQLESEEDCKNEYEPVWKYRSSKSLCKKWRMKDFFPFLQSIFKFLQAMENNFIDKEFAPSKSYTCEQQKMSCSKMIKYFNLPCYNICSQTTPEIQILHQKIAIMTRARQGMLK